MKKALLKGLGVAATLFGVFGFIFLPVFIYLAIAKYFDLSDNLDAIFCLVMFEGIFVQVGILKFFTDKKEERTPWTILQVALLPIVLAFFATFMAWPAMLLEHLGFGENAQWLGVLAWFFLVISTGITVATLDSRQTKKQKS